MKLNPPSIVKSLDGGFTSSRMWRTVLSRRHFALLEKSSIAEFPFEIR